MEAARTEQEWQERERQLLARNSDLVEERRALEHKVATLQTDIRMLQLELNRARDN